MSDTIREEWEYQDDEDDGFREIVYATENDPNDPAFVTAAEAYYWDEREARRQLADLIPKPSPLRFVPYDEYLKTPHWQTMRRRALLRAGNQCQNCGFPRRLQVHHLTYDRRGREAEGDLVVLCAWCHEKEHAPPPPDATTLVVYSESAEVAHLMSEMVAHILRGDGSLPACDTCPRPGRDNSPCGHCTGKIIPPARQISP